MYARGNEQAGPPPADGIWLDSWDKQNGEVRTDELIAVPLSSGKELCIAALWASDTTAPVDATESNAESSMLSRNGNRKLSAGEGTAREGPTTNPVNHHPSQCLAWYGPVRAHPTRKQPSQRVPLPEPVPGGVPLQPAPSKLENPEPLRPPRRLEAQPEPRAAAWGRGGVHTSRHALIRGGPIRAAYPRATPTAPRRSRAQSNRFFFTKAVGILDQPRVVGAAPALMGAHSALDTCPGNARKPWGRPNLFLAGKSGLRPKGVDGRQARAQMTCIT